MKFAVWVFLLMFSLMMPAQVRQTIQEEERQTPSVRREGAQQPAVVPDTLRDVPPAGPRGVQFEETPPFTNYRVGPQDLIQVTVLDAPELSRLLRVSGDGTLKLPLMKHPVPAGGKTSAELEQAIAEALVDEGLLREPSVTVTIRDYQSRPVSVTGAVRNPVVFQALRPMTLVEAITRAGGLAQHAGGEVIVANPWNDPPTDPVRIPIQALQDFSDPKANMTIYGGEEIRVSEAGQVYVIGGVTRPGAILLNDQQPLTLLRALALAGGTLPSAGSKAYLLRPSPKGPERQEIALNLKKLIKAEAPDLVLRDDDVVLVPDSSLRRYYQGAITAATGSVMLGMGYFIWR